MGPKKPKREKLQKPQIPAAQWNFHMRDIVEVLAGPGKGQQGEVFKKDEKAMRIWVRGCNMEEKLVADYEGDRAKRVKKREEASVHYSDVALLDPADGKPCRIRYAYLEDGNRVRLSRRSGAVIKRAPWTPPPERATITWSESTTKEEDLLQVTYEKLEWPTDPRIGVPNQGHRRLQAFKEKTAKAAVEAATE